MTQDDRYARAERLLDQLRDTLDAGMDTARTIKQTHFEAISGQRRNAEDLEALCEAAYTVQHSYKNAEDLYATWVYAPVPAHRAVSYMLAEMGLDEALTMWEPRFAAADTQAVSALEMLVALRTPEHAVLRGARP